MKNINTIALLTYVSMIRQEGRRTYIRYNTIRRDTVRYAYQ